MCYRCKCRQRTFHKKLVRCIKIYGRVKMVIDLPMPLCIIRTLPFLDNFDRHKVAIAGKIRGKIFSQDSSAKLRSSSCQSQKVSLPSTVYPFKVSAVDIPRGSGCPLEDIILCASTRCNVMPLPPLRIYHQACDVVMSVYIDEHISRHTKVFLTGTLPRGDEERQSLPHV
jgi:hypothetical protein